MANAKTANAKKQESDLINKPLRVGLGLDIEPSNGKLNTPIKFREVLGQRGRG